MKPSAMFKDKNISNRDKQTPPFISTLDSNISSDELIKISRQSNRFLKFKIAIRRFFKR